jgi:hypothetical protein
VKDRFLPIVLLLAACVFSGGCDPKPAEAERTEPVAEQESSDSAVETVEIVEAGQEGEAAPSAVLIESKIEPLSPESLPGSYRDPEVPDVIYNFAADNTWEATWQPEDETRGLMMNGVYQVESGDVLHLRVLAFGRREAFLGDDWDKRTPPHPRPRAFFRMEGIELVMMSDRTAQAFTMAPFKAARLVKIGE